MKVLLCHPGVEWSVLDVYVGLRDGLRRVGVEVVEYNLEARQDRAYWGLQMAWRVARKSSPDLPRPSWGDAAYKASCDVWERAARTQVDWIIVMSAMFFHPDAFVLLKRASTIPVAVVFTECPYDDEPQLKIAELVDACFVNDRVSLEAFQRVNPRTAYLQHAYHPAIHGTTGVPPSSVHAHDVVFVGTAWPERVSLLQSVDWSGIDLGLYGTWGNNLPAGDPLEAFIRGGVTDNAVAASLYRRAKIGLNFHRSQIGLRIGGPREVRHITHAESMNPRCYELAACGAFFVSDPRTELLDVFGDTVPTFTTGAELQALLARWLPDEVGRRSLAEAARQRVLPHHWTARARTVATALGG